MKKIKSVTMCDECGHYFEYWDYPGSKRKRLYCSHKCAKRASNRRKALRFCGVLPPSKREIAHMPFYVPNGPQMAAYSLEADPWKTGQLPASVRENALWG